jgi:hypothetical protein
VAFLTATTCFAASDTNADGSINVGSANLFTVLAKGDASFVDDGITGPSKVVGNFGVGGNGNFSMSDGDLYGDLYMHTGGKATFSGPANHHGFNTYTMGVDGVINSAIADAISLSNMAASEMASSAAAYTVNGNHTLLTTVNSGQSMTVADSNPFGSKIVLNLQDFVRTNGTFTLQGTAMTTYIINVSHNFSLNNSSVILSGGLLASHVLFNVTGGGGQVSLNQGTQMSGTLLAMGRKVDLSGGKVFGRVLANQVVITSGGQVISQ